MLLLLANCALLNLCQLYLCKLNANSLIVDEDYCGHHGNRMDPPYTPKFGSDVKTDNDTHAPRGSKKVYDSHSKAFQGKQSMLESRSGNGFGEQ